MAERDDATSLSLPKQPRRNKNSESAQTQAYRETDERSLNERNDTTGRDE